MSVPAVTAPDQFGSVPLEVHWSRRNGDIAESIARSSGKPVSKTRAKFLADGGRLTVNAEIEVSARFWNNTSGGLDVPFEINEDCIEAIDYPKPEQGINCPITLLFENPVQAVGAYVSISGITLGNSPDNVRVGDDVTGNILVELENGERHSVNVAPVGKYGFRVAKGSPIVAPFAGCKVPNGSPRIKIARFDASTHGWFESVVISRLYYVT